MHQRRESEVIPIERRPVIDPDEFIKLAANARNHLLLTRVQEMAGWTNAFLSTQKRNLLPNIEDTRQLIKKRIHADADRAIAMINAQRQIALDVVDGKPVNIGLIEDGLKVFDLNTAMQGRNEPS